MTALALTIIAILAVCLTLLLVAIPIEMVVGGISALRHGGSKDGEKHS